MMTWKNVVENLEGLVGEVIAAEDFKDELVLAFEDYEFEGENEVHVSDYLEGKFNVFIEKEDSPNAQVKTEYNPFTNTYTILSVTADKVEVGIDWDEQKQIERKIDLVEIKQTSSQEQIAKLRKTFWGVDFREAFNKLYDKDLHNDDTFMDTEENNLWTEIPEEEAIELSATDTELFNFIQDNYWYDITVRDYKTDITFDVDDCTIDWEKGTFKVNYFNENTENELEEYFEEQQQ